VHGFKYHATITEYNPKLISNSCALMIKTEYTKLIHDAHYVEHRGVEFSL